MSSITYHAQHKYVKKTLLAALVLSPSSKAVTVLDDRQWLVVERHCTFEETWYSAHIVDLREGDVTHCCLFLGGLGALQDWVYNVALDVNIDPDGDIGGVEKRWESLEEAMLSKAVKEMQRGFVVSGGLVRW